MLLPIINRLLQKDLSRMTQYKICLPESCKKGGLSARTKHPPLLKNKTQACRFRELSYNTLIRHYSRCKNYAARLSYYYRHHKDA